MYCRVIGGVEESGNLFYVSAWSVFSCTVIDIYHSWLASNGGDSEPVAIFVLDNIFCDSCRNAEGKYNLPAGILSYKSFVPIH